MSYEHANGNAYYSNEYGYKDGYETAREAEERKAYEDLNQKQDEMSARKKALKLINTGKKNKKRKAYFLNKKRQNYYRGIDNFTEKDIDKLEEIYIREESKENNQCFNFNDFIKVLIEYLSSKKTLKELENSVDFLIGNSKPTIYRFTEKYFLEEIETTDDFEFILCHKMFCLFREILEGVKYFEEENNNKKRWKNSFFAFLKRRRKSLR